MAEVVGLGTSDSFHTNLIELSQASGLRAFVAEHWTPVPSLDCLLSDIPHQLWVTKDSPEHAGCPLRSQDVSHLFCCFLLRSRWCCDDFIHFLKDNIWCHSESPSVECLWLHQIWHDLLVAVFALKDVSCLLSDSLVVWHDTMHQVLHAFNRLDHSYYISLCGYN